MTNTEEPAKKRALQRRDYPQELEERKNYLQEWFRDASECKVEVWRYHHFWQWLGLRVQECSSERKLYLECRWCQTIETPTIWQSPNFEIALFDPDDYKFAFYDANAGFRVECRAVNLEEQSWWFFENVDIMQPPKKWSEEEAAKLKITSSSFWDELKHRRIDVDSRRFTPQEITAFVRDWTERCESVKTSISSYRRESQLLDFRLQAVGEKRNLHIVCEECYFVKTTPWAHDVKVEVSFSPAEPFPWSVRDDKNLLVQCSVLKLSTDVQPLMV